jgi:hypothetical protein
VQCAALCGRHFQVDLRRDGRGATVFGEQPSVIEFAGMRKIIPALAILALLQTITAYSHHSFAAHYFEEQYVTLTGEIVEFEYKSPHAWVHILVRDEAGNTQRYSAEWANPNRLQQLRITKDTLKPGDVVMCGGSPGRNTNERKLHLKSLERPADGWKWGARTARGSRN